jgi:DNA-binding NarL/FixJ family response regulator
MVKVSVMVAGPQTLMRRGLLVLLHHARPNWQCEDIEGLDELRAKLCESTPTLLLIDLRICDHDGLRQLRVAHPYVSLVVLSDQDNRATVLSYLEAGAQGYILKSIGPDQFVDALEIILGGGVYAPASLSVTPIHPSVVGDRPLLTQRQTLSHLTQRQRNVLELLEEGCATKAIASRLHLAVGTVKVHLAGIYRTLGASSRLDALAKVQRAQAVNQIVSSPL